LSGATRGYILKATCVDGGIAMSEHEDERDLRVTLRTRAEDLRLRAFHEADVQDAEADRWLALHFRLGVPAVVLSAIAASTSALADFDHSNVVASVIALVVTVLTGLSTFLKPGETSEPHRTAAKVFKMLALRAQRVRHDLELSEPLDKALTDVHTLEDDWAKAFSESPSCARRVRRKVEERGSDRFELPSS